MIARLPPGTFFGETRRRVSCGGLTFTETVVFRRDGHPGPRAPRWVPEPHRRGVPHPARRRAGARGLPAGPDGPPAGVLTRLGEVPVVEASLAEPMHCRPENFAAGPAERREPATTGLEL